VARRAHSVSLFTIAAGTTVSGGGRAYNWFACWSIEANHALVAINSFKRLLARVLDTVTGSLDAGIAFTIDTLTWFVTIITKDAGYAVGTVAGKRETLCAVGALPSSVTSIVALSVVGAARASVFAVRTPEIRRAIVAVQPSIMWRAGIWFAMTVTIDTRITHSVFASAFFCAVSTEIVGSTDGTVATGKVMNLVEGTATISSEKTQNISSVFATLSCRATNPVCGSFAVFVLGRENNVLMFSVVSEENLLLDRVIVQCKS
jgi:hypothetical protein